VTEAVDLTCREMVELVTGYLEDTMTAPERDRFEEHIADCDGCAIYLNQMRTTIRLSGTLEEDTFPPGQLDRLTQAFRDWRRG
jgi:hypothetical protein